METGKAMAKPAISMPATSKRLARLNMAPPARVEIMFEPSAVLTLFRKLAGSSAVLPMVKARISEINKMPMA